MQGRIEGLARETRAGRIEATTLPDGALARREEVLIVTYIVPGKIYRDAEMDLQLPHSHLAFRVPAGFAGRLSANGAFKSFSADRKLSCFVFVHGADRTLPTNWMSATFVLDGETLIAVGEQKHAQSDTVYRAFEGANILAYKFKKTNRQGAGLDGSAAALKSEADRLSTFLKTFLSSLHRGEAVSWPAPTPAPIPVPAPPPPPRIAPPRDRRLIGLWYYSPTLRSGSAAMVAFRFRYFSADGHFAQGSESFATFVRSDGAGQWAGMETLRSKVAPGDRGTWETTRGVLTLKYEDNMYSEFRYYVEGNSLMLTPERGEIQVWSLGEGGT